MSTPDLNLLITLDAVLSEGSVARAARRLQLSPSAMSRSLARLREATGDPLLVRAGRALVPTPRAIALREQVGPLLETAQALLRPAELFKLAQLERSFTLRAREGFVENFGVDLIARAAAQAPLVRLCFVHKPERDSDALRMGGVDLEVGVVGERSGPELITRAMFRDRFIGVVRKGHALCKGKLTAQRYAQGRHVHVSRRGLEHGPLDAALQELGLARHIVTSVNSFAAALALARGSDLIASVPERQSAKLCAGMHCFALPMRAPQLTVSLLWHPRHDADPAHRWLRKLVFDTCTASA
ncbi:MAG: LysR family transcriptional regulator [Pseudomonadota bacterium]